MFEQFNPLKIQEMMTRAREMQEQLQQKMAETRAEGSSGGGAVQVTVNGQKQVLALKIDPAAALSLSGGSADVEMLEDLIVAALNDAGRKVDESLKSSVGGMLGGLNLPGLPG